MAMREPSRLFRGSAALLGFSLAGSLDAIVFQQAHPLPGPEVIASSAVAAPDLALHLLTYGVLQLVMYGLSAMALALLWCARSSWDRPGADLRLGGHVLAGFGAWHLAIASASFLAFGTFPAGVSALLWLGAFGIAPLLGSAALHRRSRHARGGRGARKTIMVLAAVTLLVGVIASAPPHPGPSDNGTMAPSSLRLMVKALDEVSGAHRSG